MEREMWRNGRSYQRAAAFSQGKEKQKPAEEVMDGAVVWKGSKSLLPAMGIWCILTHKRKHPSLVLSADTSQQGILSSKRKSLSITVGPVYEWSNCFYLAYLKNKIRQKSQCLQEQQIGWILHTLIGIAPHSPLLIFFGIKQSLKDMATMTLKFKALRSNTWSWRSLQLNYVTYLKAQAYYLRQYNSH